MKRPRFFQPNMTAQEYVFRSACLFGGGGGMALGTQQADQRFQAHQGRFELTGSYDFNAYACKVYEYLTGKKQEQLDARSATPGDVYRMCGGESPSAVWISAPCKGSSKLLSSAKASTEKYLEMNDLSYRGVKTLLDAFPGDEPAFLIFENVPNITTRARQMLMRLRRLLRSRGYVLTDGFHDARAIGDLAQRRKRWFMVARLPAKVPVFLYKPPCKPGKVCGDVLGSLPLPNDPAGGPMHKLSDTSFINLARLWAIPAGGDWRDLIQDGRPRRARFRRHHVEKWDQPSVTVGGSGSNGPCGIADPRAEEPAQSGQQSLFPDLERRGAFKHVDRVTSFTEPTGTVTGAGSSSNGAQSVADPRLVLVRVASAHDHVDRVSSWWSPTGTVTAARSSSSGAPSVADPRVADPIVLARACGGFTSLDHVLRWDSASRTITGATKPGSGAPSIADPRPLNLLGGVAPSETELVRWEREGIKSSGTSWFKGKYGVTSWAEPSRTVIGGAGNGSSAVADPRLVLLPPSRRGAGRWDVFSKHEVTPWCSPTRAVIGGEGNGASAVADPRLDLLEGLPNWNHGALGVFASEDIAATVTSAPNPSNGRFTYADPRIPLVTGQEAWRDDVLGVVTDADVLPTVTGNAGATTGRFSYADRRGSMFNAYGVLSPDQPAATVTAEAHPSTGAFALAARPPELRPQAGNADLHWGKYVVVPWDEASLTVTCASRVGSGATSIADPRLPLATKDTAFHEGSGQGRWGVLTQLDPASTITGNARLHTGPFSIAARPPFVPIDLSAPGIWRNRYGVIDWAHEAPTITGNARVNTGGFSIAAPAPKPLNLIPEEECYDAGYGVLSLDQPARTIAGKTAPGCGAYAIAVTVPVPAAPIELRLTCSSWSGAWGVNPFAAPLPTIKAHHRVDNATAAVADPMVRTPIDLRLRCEPRADAYGVTAFADEAATVVAHGEIDNSRVAIADPRPTAPAYVVLSYEETKRIVDGEVAVPFAVVDPENPGEPLAIVDSLKRAPFRWVDRVIEKKLKNGTVLRKTKRVRETVALVLISEDGTWHRPLTTKELAILQGFPAHHNGRPLDFGVPHGCKAKRDAATTAQREVIGNAVPPPVARAMAEQMLLSLIVAKAVGFSLGDPGTPVWVENVRALEEELRELGLIVVKGNKPLNFTTGEQLDDGGLVWTKRAPKARKTTKCSKPRAGVRALSAESYAAMH